MAACGGSFSQTIAKDQTVDIGEIPLDKKNLRVELSAGRDDVDIQLFDLDDTTCASQGGQAIIAYSSETSGCGVGVLGNNDGNEESTTYQGLQYKYSGYFGGGTAATYVGAVHSFAITQYHNNNVQYTVTVMSGFNFREIQIVDS